MIMTMDDANDAIASDSMFVMFSHIHKLKINTNITISNARIILELCDGI
jgi:hypothetical protein